MDNQVLQQKEQDSKVSPLTINNEQKHSESHNKILQKKKKEIKILSGFYPVFVFFSLSNPTYLKEIQQPILQILKQTQVEYDEVKDKHITLTKTINILQTEVKQLHTKIEKSLKGTVILPIILLFKKVKLLSNFVCLQVQKITHLKLLKVTQTIGQTIKDPYFPNPIFHISLFKLYQEQTPEFKQQLQQIKLTQKTAMLLEHLYMSAGIKKIQFSIK